MALTPRKDGADGRIRTGDLLITNQLLYQLSYIGEKGCEGGREESTDPPTTCQAARPRLVDRADRLPLGCCKVRRV